MRVPRISGGFSFGVYHETRVAMRKLNEPSLDSARAVEAIAVFLIAVSGSRTFDVLRSVEAFFH